MEWASDADYSSEANEANEKDSVVTNEATESKAKPGKTKQSSAKTATAETFATIADNCDDVLAFLQDIAIKFTRVLASPLSLHAEKRARIWSQQWTDVNLTKPPTPAPRDHLGLTGVLTNAATWLHTSEALRLVVSAQRKAEKKRQRCGTASHQQLSASSWRRALPPEPPFRPCRPPNIHRFLNARNATSLQADYSLTYAGNNIYLPTYFCQALLQGHILTIPDPDVPT